MKTQPKTTGFRVCQHDNYLVDPLVLSITIAAALAFGAVGLICALIITDLLLVLSITRTPDPVRQEMDAMKSRTLNTGRTS